MLVGTIILYLMCLIAIWAIPGIFGTVPLLLKIVLSVAMLPISYLIVRAIANR